MNRAEAIATYERDWDEWAAKIAAIDPAKTREPGVCGDWTIHDVVNHVHAYERFHLANARGAFRGIAPSADEIDGDRPVIEEVGDGMDLDTRNESIRRRGLGLGWQQLLDECGWLRAATLEFLDGLTDAEVAEPVGWVHFWLPEFTNQPNNVDGLMIRRVRDISGAADPMPVGRFIQPNEPDKHVTEHLGQITTWLATTR